MMALAYSAFRAWSNISARSCRPLSSALRKQAHPTLAETSLRNSLVVPRWRRAMHMTSTTQKEMNVHLVGPGAIGSILAYQLDRVLEAQGTTKGVTLQLRSPPPHHRPQDQVSLTLYNNDESVYGTRSFAWESPNHSTDLPIDVLILCTKADQAIDAVRPLLPRLLRGPGTSDPNRRLPTILSTQNGMGLDEEMVKHFGWHQSERGPYLASAVNLHAGWTRSRFNIVYSVPASLLFSIPRSTEARLGHANANRLLERIKESPDGISAVPIADAPESIAADAAETLEWTLSMLNSSAAHEYLQTRLFTSVTDFTISQMQKLTINCVVNPQGALHNVRNGEVSTRSDLRAVGNSIIDECATVFAARFQAAASTGTTSQKDQQSLPASLERETLRTFVWDTIDFLGANWCSMVQDIWSKRGSTEIDFLNGTIVRWAKELGIEVPFNADMVVKVKELASSAAHGT